MSKSHRKNGYDTEMMEETVFDFYSQDVQREVEEHDLSKELADMKAFNLGEWIMRLSPKQLLKEYKKIGRK